MGLLSCWKRLRLRPRRPAPRQGRPPMSPALHRTSTGTQSNPPGKSPSDIQDHEKSCETLWDRAYASLSEEGSAKLVSDYESLLAEALPDMQETESDATNNIGSNRKQKLDAIIKKGLERMDQKSTVYTVCGKQFDVRDQVAEAVHWLNQFKSFISEAVKASPEASLAWAGVCVILPLFTNPSTQAKAQSSGFDYVASRMKFYAGFEKFLWPKRTEINSELKEALEKSLEKLYQAILKFHLTSVLSFFRDGFPQFTRDVFRYDSWGDMLTSVKESEAIVTNDFKKLGDASILRELEKLSTAADEVRGSWQRLISIATEQLHVHEQQLHVQEEAKEYLQKISNKAGFASKLPVIYEALFESDKVFGKPQCQQDTRTSVIKHIMDWVDDEKAPTLLWINGPAGIGKSTISRTLASTFRGQGRLAASYFFTRDRQGLKEVACFVPTLALQLAEKFGEYQGKLEKAIKGIDREAITSRHSRLQFESLVSKPLEEAANEGLRGSTQIIIVDALDECGHRQEDQQQQIADILLLIKDFARIESPKMRVILTSRKTPTIENSLEASTDGPLPYEDMAPQDRYREDSKRDVTAYLRGVMEDLALDPIQQEKVIELATTPSPLFIYASTFCLFIADTRRGRTAKTQLKKWLASERGTSQLSNVYLPVLEDAFQLDEEERESGHLEPEAVTGRMIIGAVLLAKRPLSCDDLAGLFQIDTETVHGWLQNLQSVLHVPQDRNSPVKLLHKSFSDFMFEQGESLRGPYQLDFKACHEQLAFACLRRMETNGLRKNILGLQTFPEMLSGEKSGCIPRDLEYAVCFWLDHFRLSERQAQNLPRIEDFLKMSLLYWLEAFVITKLPPAGDTTTRFALGRLVARWAIREVMESLAKSFNLDTDSFIWDAYQFIFHMRYISVVVDIYSYNLVFSPTQSQVKKMFAKDQPGWIKVISPMPEYWGPDSNWSWDPSYNAPTEKNHVAFKQLCTTILAPRLAVLCSDGFVMTCDTQSGEWLAMLDPRYDSKNMEQPDGGAADAVESLAESAFTERGMKKGDCFTILSENGKILLSITSKRVIQFWDADSGARLGMFESSTCVLHAIAYAPDGQLLASEATCEAGNRNIQIIDFSDCTGSKVRHTLCGDMKSIKWCGFSPNSQMLAVSLEAEILVWDMSSGQRIKRFACTDEWLDRLICFSPSSQYIAQFSGQGIVVWDLDADNTNPCSQIKVEERKGRVRYVGTARQLLFSWDSRFLGTVYNDYMQTWEITTGEPGERIMTFEKVLAFEQRGHTITHLLTAKAGPASRHPKALGKKTHLIPMHCFGHWGLDSLDPWVVRFPEIALFRVDRPYDIMMDSIFAIYRDEGILLFRIECED